MKTPLIFCHFFNRKSGNPVWHQCQMPPFGYLERLNGINQRVWFCLLPVAVDEVFLRRLECRIASTIAWIHKTVSSDAALVIERCSYAIISTSRLCPVQDYSTVCKELIVEQQITTEKKCRSFCPLIGVKSEAYSYRLRWMVWLNDAHHSFVSFFAWFGILSSGHWSCGDRLQNCTALK